MMANKLVRDALDADSIAAEVGTAPFTLACASLSKALFDKTVSPTELQARAKAVVERLQREDEERRPDDFQLLVPRIVGDMLRLLRAEVPGSAVCKLFEVCD
jgi:hypothetical protein